MPFCLLAIYSCFPLKILHIKNVADGPFAFMYILQVHKHGHFVDTTTRRGSWAKKAFSSKLWGMPIRQLSHNKVVNIPILLIALDKYTTIFTLPNDFWPIWHSSIIFFIKLRIKFSLKQSKSSFICTFEYREQVLPCVNLRDFQQSNVIFTVYYSANLT